MHRLDPPEGACAVRRARSRGPLLAHFAPCSAAFCALSLFACASDDPRAPAAPDCVGTGCSPRPGGGPNGSAGPKDSGAADGPATIDAGDGSSIVTVNVTYAVRQTVDSWFYAVSDYGSVVGVHALGPGGWLTPPGEDAGVPPPPAGMLPNVAAGLNWFLVEDGSNARRIARTLQAVDIDITRPDANLRAIAIDGLTNLVIDQVLWAPPAGTATIILNFRRGGRGAAGVTVNRGAFPAGTTVAYDSAGMYVSDGMVIGTVPATDVQGTVIIREIAGAQPFPALTSATLRYSLANSTAQFPAVEAKLARDAVTWMQIDLP